MFDLVFSTLTALIQVATFVGALVCWGLGGLLVGNAIYWRRHAVRVQGEVIGVRRNGDCLNSVYRYVTPSGETLEATPTQGWRSVSGSEDGAQVSHQWTTEKHRGALRAVEQRCSGVRRMAIRGGVCCVPICI